MADRKYLVIDSESEDDELEVGEVVVPQTFVEAARAILPQLTTAQIRRAWTRAGEGGAVDYEGRSAAAMGDIFEQLEADSEAGPARGASSSSSLSAHSNGRLPSPRPPAANGDRRHMSPNRAGPVAGGSGLKRNGSNGHSPPKANGSTSPKKQVSWAFDSDSDDDNWDDELGLPKPPIRVNGHDPAPRHQNANGNAQAGPAPKVQAVEEPPPLSPEDAALATVLSIVPDVQPEHVRSLLRQALYDGKAELVLENILSDPLYPKIEKVAGGKGKKRAREEEEDDAQEPAINYLDIKRQPPNGDYGFAALRQIYSDFSNVAQSTLANIFDAHGSFYAPTYLAVRDALAEPESKRGWKLMVTRRKDKSKEEIFCFELEREKTWLQKHLKEQAIKKAKEAEAQRLIDEEIASGAWMECGCCFGETALSQIVSCTNGCTFCKECALANANNQVGMRKYSLPCMSVDGCSAVFPEGEYDQYMPATTIHALHKIKQEKEVALAELEGLETCPFCPFAAIVENPDERLFKCLREDCMVVSCRKCHKEDHLPYTCEEADKDKKINSIHRVEEAMSAALIRRCPNDKCAEPYLKDSGCNKITCSSCRTVSCYICGKIVKGYEHFKNAGVNAAYTESGATCVLWDDTASRSYKEIEDARVAALAQVRNENPAIKEDDIKNLKVDKPAALPPNPYGYYVPGLAPPGAAPLLAAPPQPAPMAQAERIRLRLEQERRERERLALEAERRVAREKAEATRRRLMEEEKRRANLKQEEREARRRRALGGVGAGAGGGAGAAPVPRHQSGRGQGQGHGHGRGQPAGIAGGGAYAAMQAELARQRQQDVQPKPRVHWHG